MRDNIEAVFEWGGIKKDIIFLVISALSLVTSMIGVPGLTVDPAWVAIVLCGVPIIVGAAIGLVCDHDIKADVLVALALIAAVAIGQYFAAGEVALIMQLGSLLEETTVARARAGIERLVELTPQVARVVCADGREQMIEANQVHLHDIVRVLPGELIPVDGVVVEGTSSVDESVVTGEPLPQDKQAGSFVNAGTLNRFGVICVRATRVGEDSSIARMARLVQSADANKAKIVRMADRWATWIVVGALLAAASVYVFTGEIIRSVTVLVVFCPCSLVLATPTAIMAAIGNATRHGFLVREGDALERLSQVKRVVFDKTGTLTKGTPQVQGFECVASYRGGVDELLRIIEVAERQSEHPLGQAIVSYAQAQNESISADEQHDGKQERSSGELCVDSFEMIPGRGVRAFVQQGERSCEVMIGNKAMMDEEDIEDAWETPGVPLWKQAGYALSYVALDRRPVAVLALGDTLRSQSESTIKALIHAGVLPVLLSGDTHEAATFVAHRLGISSVQGHCKPEDKLTYIENATTQGAACAMVGDGINDAPALKRSHVGIAMGGIGSDIAIEAADIVLVEDNLEELPHLIALSKRMMRTIKVNLTASMTLNAVAIVLAMIAVLDPVSGALVHNAGSVAVIINSALLLSWSAHLSHKSKVVTS